MQKFRNSLAHLGSFRDIRSVITLGSFFSGVPHLYRDLSSLVFISDKNLFPVGVSYPIAHRTNSILAHRLYKKRWAEYIISPSHKQEQYYGYKDINHFLFH